MNDGDLVPGWKAIGVRGAIGVLFGILAFLWPAITLTTLVVVFGVYCVIDGVLTVLAGTHEEAGERAWVLALEGAIGVAVGLVALVWTRMTAIVLVDLLALWAIFTGALELVAAARARRSLAGHGLLAAAGLVSIALGATLLAWPLAGAFAMLMLLGSYAFVFGALMILLALRVRRAMVLMSRARRPPIERYA